MASRILAPAGTVLLIVAGCAGRATDVSESSASGGAGSGGAQTCAELSAAAKQEFEDGYQAEHLACDVDADCALLPGSSCVSPCGYVVNHDGEAGLAAAIDQLCEPFTAQGCVAQTIPCLTLTAPHAPVTCQAGVCTATPPG